MKSDTKGIVILNIVLALYSFLGVFSKKAGLEKFLSGRFFLFYSVVLFGLLIYAIVWQQVLKKVPLIMAYANKAVTVVWGIIWGKLFFGENVSIGKIIGAAIVVIGIIIYALSDAKRGSASGGA